MLGFGAIGQFAIGQGPTANAETILADKWFVAFSEPVRFKPGLKASLQQVNALSDPIPIVSFGWFEELSRPQKLNKKGIPTPEQMVLAFQPAPSPFVATGWYNWLSEPVRFKPGLRAALQLFEVQNPGFIPNPSTLIEGWFNWYSEPVRSKPGLKAHLQQVLAYHPRILPKPNVTIILKATEIDTDAALFAVNVIKSNPPVSAKVSIIEIGNGNSATSIIGN